MHQVKQESFIERHISGLIVITVYSVLFGLDCALTSY
jgi:hypothetical protein